MLRSQKNILALLFSVFFLFFGIFLNDANASIIEPYNPLISVVNKTTTISLNPSKIALSSATILNSRLLNAVSPQNQEAGRLIGILADVIYSGENSWRDVILSKLYSASDSVCISEQNSIPSIDLFYRRFSDGLKEVSLFSNILSDVIDSGFAKAAPYVYSAISNNVSPLTSSLVKVLEGSIVRSSEKLDSVSFRVPNVFGALSSQVTKLGEIYDASTFIKSPIAGMIPAVTKGTKNTVIIKDTPVPQQTRVALGQSQGSKILGAVSGGTFSVGSKIIIDPSGYVTSLVENYLQSHLVPGSTSVSTASASYSFADLVAQINDLRTFISQNVTTGYPTNQNPTSGGGGGGSSTTIVYQVGSTNSQLQGSSLTIGNTVYGAQSILASGSSVFTVTPGSGGRFSVAGDFWASGNASISGSTSLGGIAYTWPTSQAVGAKYLQNNGSGALSWAAVQTITSNSLDFDELVSSMNLDANLTIASHGYSWDFLTTNFKIAGTASIGNTFFAQKNNGNVGIGTTNPTAKLDVRGGLVSIAPSSLGPGQNALAVNFPSGGSGISLYSNDANGNDAFYVDSIGTTYSNQFNVLGSNYDTVGFYAQGKNGQTSDFLEFKRYGASVPTFVVDRNGNLGIGTSTATTKLEVQGTSSASYGIFGALQVADFSSTSYSRFGTSITTHSNYINAPNDVLISGDISVVGTGSFAIASASKYFGSAFSGLAGTNGCAGANDTLNYNSTTGVFLCGSDASGSGGGISLAPSSADSDSSSNPSIWVNDTAGGKLLQLQHNGQNEFYVGNTGYLVASSSINVGLTGNTATTSYSRFGTSTTSHSNYISAANDLLISGDLEVKASVNFSGNASISNSIFANSSTGNVGIGTINPATKLDISGVVQSSVTSIQQTVGSNTLAINYARAGVGGYIPGLVWYSTDNNATKPKAAIWSQDTGSGSYIYLGTSNNYGTGVTNSGLTIDISGNVGIGTTSPSSKLAVGTGSIADGNLQVQISTGASGTEANYAVNKNGGYGFLLGYKNNNGNLGSYPSFTGGYMRQVTTDPFAIVINNTTLSSLWNSSGDVFLGHDISSSTGTGSVLSILTTGNVGIGTTNVDSKFELVGGSGITTQSVASVSALSLTSGNVFRMLVPPSSSFTGNIMTAVNTNGVTLFSIRASGEIAARAGIFSHGAVTNCTGVASPNRGCVDYAEDMPTTDTTISAGDIISVNRQDSGDFAVVKSANSYDDQLLGIVSTDPGIVLGDSVRQGDFAKKHVDGKVPVALAGRVPVKISFENGDIKKGDYITSSAKQSGYGMKATKPGRVVGIALENASQNSGNTTVLVLVNPHYAGRDLDASGKVANFSGNAIITQDGAVDVSTLFAGLYSYFKDNLNIVFEQGSIKLTKLVADIIEVGSLHASNVQSDRGITTYDTVTGEAYCMQVANGQVVSHKGDCYGSNSDNQTNNIIITPTPSISTVPLIIPASVSLTPTPIPVVVSASTSIDTSSSINANPSHSFEITQSLSPLPTQTITVTPIIASQ